MAHDVFISHSAKDKTVADAVCATLEAAGIRCWVAPRDILPSADWGESIINAIEGSRLMLLIFSSHSNQSVQVKREIQNAVDEGVAILPLRIEDVPLTKSLRYFLGSVHWLDALTPPLEAHLKGMTAKIQALLALPPSREFEEEPASPPGQPAARLAAPIAPPGPLPGSAPPTPTAPPPVKADDPGTTGKESRAAMEAPPQDSGTRVDSDRVEGPDDGLQLDPPTDDDLLLSDEDDFLGAPLSDDHDDFLLTLPEDDDAGSQVISLVDVDWDLKPGADGTPTLRAEDNRVFDATRPLPPLGDELPVFSLRLPLHPPSAAGVRACWGVDLGVSGLRAVCLARSGEDVKIETIYKVSFNPPLSDPAANSDSQIHKALSRWAQKCFRDGTLVFTGVTSLAVESGMMPVEVARVKKVLADKDYLRAQMQLATPLESMAWDFQVFTDAREPQGRLAVMGVPLELRARRLGYFEAVGMKIDGLVALPQAAVNALAWDLKLSPESRDVDILDMGSGGTDVVRLTAGAITFHRLPVGGDRFTLAIATRGEVPFAQAADMKHHLANQARPVKIMQAMKSVFGETIDSLHRCLDAQAADRFLAVGSAVQMPGLCRYLSLNLNTEVQRVETFTRLDVPPGIARILDGSANQFVPAFGLALQGLGLGRLTFNFVDRPRSLLRTFLGKIWG